MSIWRRMRNLWRMSGIEYAPMQAQKFVRGGEITPKQVEEMLQLSHQEAKIIHTIEPSDELLETIRQENTREA